MSSEWPKPGNLYVLGSGRCFVAIQVKGGVRGILISGVVWLDVHCIKIHFGSGYTLHTLHRLLEGD